MKEDQRGEDDAVRRSIANSITYHIYIDLLVQRKDYNEANRIFDAGKLALVKKIVNKKKAIDLHNFSHGSGFLAIQRALQQLPPGESELVIITGKGCKEDGNYLSFRTELQKKIENEFNNLIYLVDSHNQGILLVQRLVDN